MRTVFKATILAVVISGATGIAGAATPPPAPAQPRDVAPVVSPLTSAAPSADSATLAFETDPADAPRADLNTRNAPSDLPVEAIPTPTAVRSGLVGLAVLVGMRMVRRLRLA